MERTISENIQVIEHDMEELTIVAPKQRKQKTPIQTEERFRAVFSIIDHVKPALKKQQYLGKDVCKSLVDHIREIQKDSTKQAKKKVKHAPSRETGFTKPFKLLPPVAAAFPGCPDSMCRAAVTHLVNDHVKDKNLQIAGRKQWFVFDQKLATYFCGNVDDLDCYKDFTKRVRFAFPIVPKLRVIKSLADLGAEGGADCDAVVVLSYNAQFLTKSSDKDELFAAQISLNRVLGAFADAAEAMKIPDRVLFFVINDAIDFAPTVFVQTRNTEPATANLVGDVSTDAAISVFRHRGQELSDFEVWLRQRLGDYIATAN